MTALWITIGGVLGLCCWWLSWWLIRQPPKDYTHVDALRALKPLIAAPKRKRQSHLFRFQWRYAQDLERKKALMFSVRQKREIADAVQHILRATNHPELPTGEIQFRLHVKGAAVWSWADIRNNERVPVPDVNPHNEAQDLERPRSQT